MLPCFTLDLNGLRLPWSKHRKIIFYRETCGICVGGTPLSPCSVGHNRNSSLLRRLLRMSFPSLKNLAIANAQNISAHHLRLLIIIIKIATSIEFTIKPCTLETRFCFHLFWFPILFCQLTTLFVLSISQPVSSSKFLHASSPLYFFFPSEWECLLGINTFLDTKNNLSNIMINKWTTTEKLKSWLLSLHFYSCEILFSFKAHIKRCHLMKFILIV